MDAIKKAFSGKNNVWCAPSKLYFVISMFALAIMGMQNFGNQDIYCIGNYSCNTNSTLMLFFLKFIYILFWTWILNLICDVGLPHVSWFLVLFPFLLLFIILASFMIT